MIELLDYLLFLCIMYSVFCVCFLQLDTSVISSTWNWSIGSGPSNRERAKLEVLLSGISCQPSTSDHSITITSLPLHQRANCPDLWEVCHQHSIECETLYNMNKLRLVDLIHLSSSHSASVKKRGYIEKELFSSAS